MICGVVLGWDPLRAQSTALAVGNPFDFPLQPTGAYFSSYNNYAYCPILPDVKQMLMKYPESSKVCVINTHMVKHFDYSNSFEV